ncbi:hypothetical protein A2U01_0061429, partial [Trifolium medium]|nr:hypothetical protein [Trifolium medium]
TNKATPIKVGGKVPAVGGELERRNVANKENNPQPAGNERNATWPTYGLPPGYTPLEAGSLAQPPPVHVTISVTLRLKKG